MLLLKLTFHDELTFVLSTQFLRFSGHIPLSLQVIIIDLVYFASFSVLLDKDNKYIYIYKKSQIKQNYEFFVLDDKNSFMQCYNKIPVSSG